MSQLLITSDERTHKGRYRAGGGGTFEAAPRGGWDGQRGPPFFSSGGEAAPRAKWAAHHFALGAAHPPLVASAALGAVQIPGRY